MRTIFLTLTTCAVVLIASLLFAPLPALEVLA